MEKIFQKNNGERTFENGFTIIETIVAIFVFTIIIAVTGTTIVSIYRTQNYAVEQAVAIDEARRGIEIMAKEIRGARYGDDGGYPIEKAAGKEFVFYSDIDADGQAERVRYFLATVNSGSQIQECYTASQGGTCSASFNNFLQGTLKAAQVQVSTEGYYGTSSRYSEFFVDGVKRADICSSSCLQCAGAWQGTRTFDVVAAAADNSVQFAMDSTNNVRRLCQWINPNHAMKARFELSWIEEIPDVGNELRKGVIEPVGTPPAYPLDQESSKVITSYVRNGSPIFSYYDADGNQISDDPSILRDTKMMKLLIVVNVNPARAPYDYGLEQYIQIRNLKD